VTPGFYATVQAPGESGGGLFLGYDYDPFYFTTHSAETNLSLTSIYTSGVDFSANNVAETEFVAWAGPQLFLGDPLIDHVKNGGEVVCRRALVDRREFPMGSSVDEA